MLARIRTFLQARGQACLADIAAHLGVDERAVEPMLALLERRGRVRRIVMHQRLCGGCTRCDPQARIEWAWAGDDDAGSD